MSNKTITRLMRPLRQQLTTEQQSGRMQKELEKIQEILTTALEQSHAGMFVEHHCPAMYACAAISVEFGEHAEAKAPHPPTYAFLLKEIRDKKLLESDATLLRTVNELLEVYDL